MANTMYSISADWTKQEIEILFCDEDGDENFPTTGIALSRQEAVGLATSMLQYAYELSLTEDEFWGEDE